MNFNCKLLALTLTTACSLGCGSVDENDSDSAGRGITANGFENAAGGRPSDTPFSNGNPEPVGPTPSATGGASSIAVDNNGSGGDPDNGAGSTSATEGFQTIKFLNSIRGKSIVSGQHNDQKDGTDEDHYTERVKEITGKYPALYGADFLFHGSSEARWAITYEAERQWEAGAIINIMWHACPPSQGEVCNWDGGLLSHLSDEQWQDLTTEGGTLNNIWKARIDQIAIYLQYLEDKGVEVLWRPLHEQNQGAFWWGGRTGENGTKKLFRLTHDYMSIDKGLSNLIWVWDVQDLSTNYGDYNPGAEYFDLAALDVYSDAYQNNAYYEALLAEAEESPVAIGECFGLPPAWALDKQAKWTFFMNWAYGLEVDWNGAATNSVEFIREVYADPRVLTLDEMPGWN